MRTYPIPTLLLAGLAGFLIGRWKGPELVESVTEFAADEIDRVGREFLARPSVRGDFDAPLDADDFDPRA